MTNRVLVLLAMTAVLVGGSLSHASAQEAGAPETPAEAAAEEASPAPEAAPEETPRERKARERAERKARKAEERARKKAEAAERKRQRAFDRERAKESAERAKARQQQEKGRFEATTLREAQEEASRLRDQQARESADAEERAAIQVEGMVRTLRDMLESSDVRIRNVANEMARLGTPATRGLSDLLNDPVPEVRRSAALALSQLQSPMALRALISAMGDEESSVAITVVEAVAAYDGRWPTEALVRWAGHPVAEVSAAVLKSLANRDHALIQHVVRRQLANPPVSVGAGPYLTVLGRFPDRAAAGDLFAVLDDPQLGSYAVQGLGHMGDVVMPDLAMWLGRRGQGYQRAAADCGQDAACLAGLGQQMVEAQGARILVMNGAVGQAAFLAVVEALSPRAVRAGVLAFTEKDEDGGASRLTLLAGHSSSEVRLTSLALLGAVEGSDPGATVVSNLSHDDARVRRATIAMLRSRGRDTQLERAVIDRYREIARHRTADNAEERCMLLDVLGSVGEDEAIAELIQAIGRDDEMEASMLALGAIGEKAIGALLFVVKTGDPKRTPIAVEALAKAGQGAVEPIMKLLRHRSMDVRNVARRAIIEMGIVEVVPRLIDLIRDGRTPGRAQLLGLLGMLYTADSHEALADTARNHPEIGMRMAAVRVLSHLDNPDVLPVLRDVIAREGSNEVRHQAVRALIWQGDTGAVPQMIRMLGYERDFIRKTLAFGLGYLAGPEHIPALIEKMDTPRAEIITAIRHTIRRVMYRPDLNSIEQFEDWHADWEMREELVMEEMKPGQLTLPDGTLISYWLGGEGRPLLILHDGPDLAHDYLRPGLDVLADDRLLFYVDLPGRGGSGRPTRDGSTLGLEHDVQSVATLLVRINLRDMEVYGHGWGAMVAVRLAEKYPQLVSKLVLDNAPMPTMEAWARRVEASARRAPEPWRTDLLRIDEDNEDYRPVIRDQFLTRALMTGSVKVPAVLLDLAPKLRRDPALRGAIVGPMGDFDLRDSFAAISKPTLMLYGDGSPLDDDAVAWRDHLIASNTNVQMEMIFGSGYVPFVENPRPWSSAILRFLR